MDTNEQVCFRMSDYYMMARIQSGNDGGRVFAETHADVTKEICECADMREVQSFRSVFESMFQNPEQAYELTNADVRAEVKGMLLVVSMMMLNVEDIKCKESVELKPFAEQAWKNVYYANAGQAMGIILFGSSKGKVSFRNLRQYYDSD